MNAKYLLGLVALSGMTMTSCSQSEDAPAANNGHPIEFNTYVGKNAQSRAASASLETIQQNGFKVFAYNTGKTLCDSLKQLPTNYYLSTNYSYSNNAWTPENVYYWPDNDYVTFAAVSPNNNYTSSKIDFTVNDDVDQQVDLLRAFAQDQNYENNGSGVSLDFRHVLCRIDFTAKCGENVPEGTEIIITSVTFSGDKIYKAGTYDLFDNYWDFTDVTTSYSLKESNLKKSAIVKYTAPSALEITNDDSKLMIIPQEIKGITISISYKYKLKGDSEYKTVSVKKALYGDYEFDAGYSYAFQLEVSLNQITIVPSFIDWGINGSIKAQEPVVEESQSE